MDLSIAKNEGLDDQPNPGAWDEGGAFLNVALITPEIPQNTGNIIRLCANIGAHLHLVEPLGFRLRDPLLKRAALDYTDLVNISTYSSVDDLFHTLVDGDVYGAVTDGPTLYTDPRYLPGDTIVFGPESVGLSDNLVSRLDEAHRVRIPMRPSNRSLNLSNAAAIIAYEMWRQLGFVGSI